MKLCRNIVGICSFPGKGFTAFIRYSGSVMRDFVFSNCKLRNQVTPPEDEKTQTKYEKYASKPEKAHNTVNMFLVRVQGRVEAPGGEPVV